MEATEREAWCPGCDAKTTFYKASENAAWRCSLCEGVLPEEKPKEEALEPVQPKELPFDDLAYIAIFLKGPWSKEDLANLGADLQMSKDGAAEGGLGLDFFAVPKHKPGSDPVSMGASGLVLPFRDRHGNVIRVARLPFRKR